MPGKFELTVQLTRVMLPFLTLVALAAACMGMLNSLDRYFLPALAPALFNVASIITTIVAVPVLMWLGLPAIYAMALGVLTGGLAQLLVQWPALRREGFRHQAVLDPAEPGLRQVLLLMGPGTLGLAATQVNVFVNTWLATGEGTGAVSWLGYAFRLMYLPLGIFGVSIATASLPAIARRAAGGDLAGMRDTVSSSLAMMLTLNVPATVGLIVLAHPIVALLFERGQFTPERYRRHGGRVGGLRGRVDRVLGGEDRVADVLRAGRKPHAGAGQRAERADQRGAEHPVRPRVRLSRPGAGHVADGAAQRGPADAAAAAAARRPARCGTWRACWPGWPCQRWRWAWRPGAWIASCTSGYPGWRCRFSSRAWACPSAARC